MVDQGAYEFAETENFLKIGEDLLGNFFFHSENIFFHPPKWRKIFCDKFT